MRRVMRYGFMVCGVMMAASLSVSAQAPASRPASPAGVASAQVSGAWVKGTEGDSYKNGKWIDVTYGRPLLRGRANIFGSGADYGKKVRDEAPVWRAGANQTTKLKTEGALKIGDKVVPAGEYDVFIDLKEGAWTLILSTWPTQQKYDPKDTTMLWGSYGYTPDKDVARVPMKMEMLASTVEQLTFGFVDMTATGGRLALSWDKTMASVAFSVAP